MGWLIIFLHVIKRYLLIVQDSLYHYAYEQIIWGVISCKIENQRNIYTVISVITLGQLKWIKNTKRMCTSGLTVRAMGYVYASTSDY